MKKFALGLATALGVISTILTLIDALPGYKSYLIFIMGMALGFFFGAFSKDEVTKSKMEPKTKRLVITGCLLSLPVFLLCVFLFVLHLLNVLTLGNVGYVVGWGCVPIVIAYIAIGISISENNK
jgi:hypothetical protein